MRNAECGIKVFFLFKQSVCNGGVWILECRLDIMRIKRMKSIEFLFPIPNSAFRI